MISKSFLIFFALYTVFLFVKYAILLVNRTYFHTFITRLYSFYPLV